MAKLFRELGKKVKQYRKNKGYTSLELADRLNVSVGHISNIENGKNDIFKLELLFNLANELDVSVEDLLNISSIGLNDIVSTSEKIEIDLVRPREMEDYQIVVTTNYLKLLISNYVDTLAQYNFQEESIETLTKHLIDELSFVNKLNKFSKGSPV